MHRWREATDPVTRRLSMRYHCALIGGGPEAAPRKPRKDKAPAKHRRLTLAGLCHHDRNALVRQHAVSSADTPAFAPDPHRRSALAACARMVCRTWFGLKPVRHHCSTVWTHAAGCPHSSMLPWNAAQKARDHFGDTSSRHLPQLPATRGKMAPQRSRASLPQRLGRDNRQTSSRDSGAGAERAVE